jgi:hypothetical protein
MLGISGWAYPGHLDPVAQLRRLRSSPAVVIVGTPTIPRSWRAFNLAERHGIRVERAMKLPMR